MPPLYIMFEKEGELDTDFLNQQYEEILEQLNTALGEDWQESLSQMHYGKLVWTYRTYVVACEYEQRSFFASLYHDPVLVNNTDRIKLTESYIEYLKNRIPGMRYYGEHKEADLALRVVVEALEDKDEEGEESQGATDAVNTAVEDFRLVIGDKIRDFRFWSESADLIAVENQLDFLHRLKVALVMNGNDPDRVNTLTASLLTREKNNRGRPGKKEVTLLELAGRNKEKLDKWIKALQRAKLLNTSHTLTEEIKSSNKEVRALYEASVLTGFFAEERSKSNVQQAFQKELGFTGTAFYKSDSVDSDRVKYYRSLLSSAD